LCWSYPAELSCACAEQHSQHAGWWLIAGKQAGWDDPGVKHDLKQVHHVSNTWNSSLMSNWDKAIMSLVTAVTQDFALSEGTRRVPELLGSGSFSLMSAFHPAFVVL
jgi:hypothetical protein